jgi:hypothetical protein
MKYIENQYLKEDMKMNDTFYGYEEYLKSLLNYRVLNKCKDLTNDWIKDIEYFKMLEDMND